MKLLDDLPGREILFVGIGADEVEVELIGVSFGEEVAAAGENDSRSKKLVFDQAVDGFDVALEGVSGGRDGERAGCRRKAAESRCGGPGGCSSPMTRCRCRSADTRSRSETP